MVMAGKDSALFRLPRCERIRRITIGLRFFTSALFAVFSVHHAEASRQDANPKVTFQRPMASVVSIIQDLAKQTDVPIRVDPEMRNEILLISVRNQPLRRVLHEIAEATAGEWVASPSGQALVRSRAGMDLRHREELAWQRTLLKPQFDAMTIPIAEPYTKEMAISGLGVTKATPHPTYWGDPPNRLLRPLLKRIGFDAIAQVKPGERIVFSTDPNPRQLRLPPLSKADIDRYRQEQHYIDQVAATIPHTYGNDGIVEGQYFDDPPKPLPEVGKILVTIKGYVGLSQRVVDESFTMNIEIFDRQGHSIRSAGVALNAPDAKVNRHEPPPGPNDTPLNLTERSRAFYLPIFKDSGVPQPSLYRETNLHPDLYDPVGFGVSEALLEESDKTGRNEVAVLPDSVIPLMLVADFNSKWSVNQLLDLIVPNVAHWVDEVGGWRKLVPNDPISCMRMRCDRLSMKQLAGSISLPGSMVNAFCAYYYANPNVFEWDLAYQFTTHVKNPDSGWGGDHRIAGFYGSLWPGARDKLLRTGQIPVLDLTTAQRVALNRLLYDANEWGSETSATPTPGRKMAATLHEPTERFPYGVPSNAVVTLEIHRVPMLAFHNDYIWQISGIEEVVYFMQNKQTFEALMNSPRATYAFKPAHEIEYVFAIHLASGSTLRADMREAWFDSSAGMPFSELPIATRKAMLEFAKKLRVALPGVVLPPERQP